MRLSGGGSMEELSPQEMSSSAGSSQPLSPNMSATVVPSRHHHNHHNRHHLQHQRPPLSLSRLSLDAERLADLPPTDILHVCQTHHRWMSNRIKSLYLVESLVDVWILCGNERIPAHRLVLAAVSDYFNAMFTSTMIEANNKEIEIKGIQPSSLRSLINYAYTGEIRIDERNVEELLSGASLIQISQVVEACSKFLRSRLHPSNCLGIRSFADVQGCPLLKDSAHNYITENFMEVMGEQEFLELSPEDLFKLLSSDELNVESENEVFKALNAWLMHDPNGRQSYVGRLLAAVRLPFLSPPFISDHIENGPYFKDDPSCQELVIEALKYHLMPDRRQSMQLGNRSKPRKSTVGNMYAFGGQDSSKGPMTIEKYDYRRNEWSTVGRMSGRRQQFGVAVINDKVMVVGGRDGLKTLNCFESWDPCSGHWISLSPMSTGRHGLAVGVLQGPLYAIGGHDGWSYLASAERWDPISKTWTCISEMGTARSTAGVAALNGKLYVVGGRDSSHVLDSVEAYNPHTNKWCQVGRMNRRRSGVAVGSWNDNLYALGGMESQSNNNPSSTRLSSLERYDPTSNEWTLLSGGMSIGRDGIGLAILSHYIFAVGGYDGQRFLHTVERYDIHTNRWEKVSDLKTGRTGTCMVVLRRGVAARRSTGGGEQCFALYGGTTAVHHSYHIPSNNFVAAQNQNHSDLVGPNSIVSSSTNSHYNCHHNNTT